jgi:hypothetical protein
LLGVADPVLTDKDDDGAGAPYGVFKGRDPPKAWPQLAAIEKGGEALVAQPIVQAAVSSLRE